MILSLSRWSGVFFIGLILASCLSLQAHSNNATYSLVFVYLGEQLPDYIEYSTLQARSFNKECNIFLIINKAALKSHKKLLDKIERKNITIIQCEDLIKSQPHRDFDDVYKKHAVEGYWKFTTERFFYIYELMIKYNLQNVFQVECDVLIYFDLKNYVPILQRNATTIACPFQNEYLASVSFIYFADSAAIKGFVEFIPKQQRGQFLGRVPKF